MRYHEIASPRSHPYIATITIDPADFYKFERLTEDRPEVVLLHRDDCDPDYWTLSVGCASAAVASRLEAGWG
jgi:hypothetical protein